MYKVQKKNLFAGLTFFFTSCTTYLLFLSFYDSTTGLDYGLKYSQYIAKYAFGSLVNLQDGQSIIYYYFISKLVAFNADLIGPYNLNNIINNSIQSGNYLLTLFGYLGLYNFYKLEEKNTSYLLYSFSILNFFPPLIYLRLTFKSEILAFALMPWVLYLFQRIKSLDAKLNEKIIFVIFFSTLLSIKPSVTGMVLLAFVILEYNNLNSNFKYFFWIALTTLIILYFNFKLIGLNFFEHTNSGSDTIWDNRANLKFFFYLNFVKLISEPIFNFRSDSFISIILIDTYSDYFTFFWKHKEFTNLLAKEPVQFSNNFFIKKYLRDYFAIFLSSLTYISLIINLLLNKDKHRRIYSFVFLSLLILIINSLGIPKNNFNPLTGDTFKVHYFAFMLTISVAHLLITNDKFIKRFLILIPIFIFIMGFPKPDLSHYKNFILYKLESSAFCYIFEENENCRNKYINTCKFEYPKFIYNNSNLENYYSYIQPIKLNLENNFVYVRNIYECNKYFNEGYSY